MKKNIFISAFMLIAMTITGCVSETVNEHDTQTGTVLTAGFIETKTVLENDAIVKWTDGDQICVNGNVSEALALETPSTTATFSFGVVMEPAYSGVFPASIYKDAETVVLPAVQTFKSGTFAESAAPMAAYTADGSNLKFSHLCSVLKLTINKSESDNCNIGYIEFSGKNNEKVSGDFEIDYTTKTLRLSTAENDADKKVRYNVGQAQSEENALIAYIAVPAHEYTNGFSIKIVDKYGHYMVKESGAKTLYAGKVHEMPAITFAPEGTEFGVEIKSAAELIAFAKAYNEGAYSPSDINPLVVKLSNDIEFTDEENAEFVSIGDDGENKFKGVFYGDNKTISNFNSGKALFRGLHDTGVVQDLTISGNSTIAVSSDDNFYSPFVDYNRGLISGCTSNVNLTVNGNEANIDIAVAGISARSVVGTIRNCISNGDIKVSVAYTAGKIIYIGGIVGWASNSEGLIEESISNGQIYFNDGTKLNKLRLGGICGHNQGKISVSTVNKDNSLNSEFAINGNNATIIVGNKISDGLIGGIAGFNENSIDCCNNNADISVISDDYLTERLGGIVGYNKGTVTKSNNNTSATITGVSSYAKNRAVGGIIGMNESNSSVSECYNYAAVNANPGKFTQLGGIVGLNKATISKSGNDGAVTLIENTTRSNCDIKVGGIVGENACDLSASTDSPIYNSGKITVTAPSGGFSGGLKVGGAIGSSNNPISGLTNTGDIEANKVQYLGGVIGYTDKAVSDCRNEGDITVTEGTKNTIIGNNASHDDSNINTGTIE